MKPMTILRRKAKLGNQGFPLATLAYYGPDDKKPPKRFWASFFGMATILRSTAFSVKIKMSGTGSIFSRASLRG
jgi:hypothetical protein